MKINVDAPLHQEDIISLLEHSEEPVCKYIGHPAGIKTTLQFEVDEDTVPEEYESVEECIKSLIKKQDWALAMGFHISKAFF
jgi:ribosome-binding factor A